MLARQGLLAVAVLVAFAYLRGAPHVPRSPIDEDMPHAAHVAVAAPETIEELQQELGKAIARDHIPGTAIALVGRDGPIWIGGIGVRDRETGAPMDGDTAFRVGSLSKSIVALGVMRLVDQGKLDVDRPLREILPDVEIDNPWEATAPVTLAQCLEHTAGFDDVRFNEIFTDDEHLTVRDALRINPRSRRVRWQPGTRHAYSNVGYTIAARAIEVASGEPFDEYLRREVLRPMGIVDSDFARTGTLAARLATGYQDGRATTFHAFAHRPSASLLTSANDLAKLVQFWLRRGEGYPPIVSAAGLARIERSGTLPYPHLDNDYGFANYGDVWHPVFARGHDGGMPGYHASFRYFPSLGVGYVMLLNSNYSFQGYVEIRDLLFGYLTRGGTFVPPRAAASERPGAGHFSFENPRNEVFAFIDQAFSGWDVSDSDDGIRVDDLIGESYTLVPAADGAYRRPNECGSTVRFLTGADGTPLMITSFNYGEAAPGWFAHLRRFLLVFAFKLLAFAPLWAGIMLGLGAIQRRRILPPALVVWPAVAGLCCFALPKLLVHAFDAGVIGVVHPLTVGVCVLSLVFAVASVASLITALRWLVRPDRPRLWHLVVPTLCGLAFTGIAVWAHALIGFRTWAW